MSLLPTALPTGATPPRCGPEPLFDAVERLANFHDIALVDRVELLLQKLEFERGMKIDFVVALGAIPIQRRFAILPHHGDGRGIGSLKRQHQIEQDEGVRSPGCEVSDDVDDNPGAENERLKRNKAPRAYCCGDPIGDSLGGGE
jgi:hypothetical protein